ncbi:hypothetical protein CN975_16480 [Bacillus cereus]|uniref:TdeIII family type II restriction endonuclease n=1 Tax=Bacillus cereus TaxID=1396 RepID=UPI000BF4BBE5|nr:TdeIII family type II restriction endonuclease [Bacillus cereus]PEQ99010.1 hypothetical protein CN477_25830 [Bacillus cereus]PFC05036.1 hypothetical protein CN280_16930 [Bacillus cereus]PFF10700.1 hypothetical protein CN343_25015 [Bacillus cereus]PFK21474.1 hypothetical protein COJ03_16865 [Bacillus cereus]PGK12231.1 hypothetical protein CN895_18235 [Bacillus cereus]
MDEGVKKQIYQLVYKKLSTKIESYRPESEHKPFFSRIFSNEMIVTHSLIQSFYTSFGMSIYEQMAEMLAYSAGYEVHRQYRLEGDIDLRTAQFIDEIWEHDKTYGSGNKLNQIEQIRENIYPARSPVVHNDSVVDIFIKRPDGWEFYIDIKTVKPNKENFQSFKRKLLRWVGYRLSVNPSAKLVTAIAIPYNPFHPTPYSQGMRHGQSLDANYDILVQEQFWNLVGGSDTTYIELLEIFTSVGNELRNQVEEMFS